MERHRFPGDPFVDICDHLSGDVTLSYLDEMIIHSLQLQILSVKELELMDDTDGL